MPAEHILLRQVIDAREVISSLIRVHSLQKPDRDGSIVPGDVPLRVLSLRQMVFESELGDLLDNIVVRMISVHHQSIRLVGDILRVQLTLFLLLVARREPIRVI